MAEEILMLRTSSSPLAILACLAALVLFAGTGRSEEGIEVESRITSTADALLKVQATGRGGPIQAFVLSLTFDPGEVEVVDMSPTGEWLDANSPDFVRAVGTLSDPGEPGIAGLAVILDAQDDGLSKAIPPLPGGELQPIAALSVELLPRPAGGAPAPIRIDLENGAASFGSSPPMFNSLVIGGQDYYEGSAETPLVLRSGSILQLLRGDANLDGSQDITDAIFILNFLFQGGEAPSCPDLADVNNDGAAQGIDSVDISDAVFLLGFLFLGGQMPDPAEGCP
jgi:hypothetical protein